MTEAEDVPPIEETQDPTANPEEEEKKPVLPSMEEKKETNNKDLEFVFKNDRDSWPPRPLMHIPPKPYPDDGNPEMYTEENIERREQLRNHPNVKSGIEQFLRRFTRTGKDKKNCPKEEYVRVFVRVGQILRPGIDIDDLGKIIQEEFDNDCRERKRKPVKKTDEDGEPIK